MSKFRAIGYIHHLQVIEKSENSALVIPSPSIILICILVMPMSYALTLTAPSAPTNVTVIEVASTYAVFQWEAPESPNGVIQRYILSLTDSRDSSVVSVNITDASELTTNVTGLDPFVQYWVTVFAETTEIGEGSTNFSFTTHQDSKLTLINVFFLGFCREREQMDM